MFQYRLLRWGQQLIERGAWYLAPIGWAWGFVSWCRNSLYDWHWLQVVKVERPVVSVGNLVAGGTGKTPLVHLLAKTFASKKVAILTRGYGSCDEPALLKRRLPQATIYIGKDRAALAKQAVSDGAELLILDDGFQHRKLHRDFDLVILDGSDPFGKGHYLPQGFLRDSPSRLNNVDAVFMQGGTFGQICLRKNVVRILDAEERQVPSIQGWPVAIFCGIAKPESFKKTVVDLGAQVVAEWFLADHEPATSLVAFAKRAKLLGAKALLCTEKDFVKRPVSGELPLLFLEIELEITAGHLLWEKLVEKIADKIDNQQHYE